MTKDVAKERTRENRKKCSRAKIDSPTEPVSGEPDRFEVWKERRQI